MKPKILNSYFKTIHYLDPIREVQLSLDSRDSSIDMQIQLSCFEFRPMFHLKQILNVI